MKYLVTITKCGQMEVEAGSAEGAERIAAELESQGAFEMGIEIEVEDVTPPDVDLAVYVGVMHERPDGVIVRTYGAGTNRVSWYDDNDNRGHATHAEYATWKPRPDLADFPNARDPRLPYVFDLYWDIKYLSELKRTLQNEWFFDLEDLKVMLKDHPEVEQMLNTKK